MPRLCELERPHDSPPVVGVHGRRSLGIDVGEDRVRVLGALVVDGTPPLAGAGGRRRGNLELGECCPEVQAGSADHDGGAAGLECRVDRGVREVLELGDRRLVVERPDPDEGGG